MPDYMGERNDLIPQFGIAMYLLRGTPFRIGEREFHEIDMADIRRAVVALTRPENFGGDYRAPAAPTRPTEARWRHACLQLKSSLQRKQRRLGVPALHLRQRVSDYDGSVFNEERAAVDYVSRHLRAEPTWQRLADEAAHSCTAESLVSRLGFTLDEIDRWIKENWTALPAGPPAAPDTPPDRRRVEINRIQRDTAIVAELKSLYEWECQLCGETIELPDGSRYAEAHHIHPLGEPHNSTQDSKENLLIVCPNCHVKLDYGAIALDLDSVSLRPPHEIDATCIRYHNERILRRVRTTD